ncbi:hypothetical protein [Paraburkholderia tropica]|uniref:hypothetical protein n=1 Tax=Paraburkholderia tropica TaxID=92647 RepID=UPI001F15C4E5|nr:hypothetical protein [Paraburkholderia tropica]
MPNTLILGDFTFQDMEIPEVIGFGGDQRLSIKRLLGGVRVIDAMGGDPRPIEWSGTFFPTISGQSALDRALMLKQIQDAAQPITLSWDELYLTVLIRSYIPDYQFGRIPYRISCEVLEDLTAPVYTDASPNADDLINGDMDSISSLVPSIGDSTLTGLTSTLQSAVSSVSTFVGAARSTIAQVLTPLNAARQYAQSLVTATDSILSTAANFANVIPGVTLSKNITNFEAQLNAATRMSTLLQLNSFMGRLGSNVTQINSSVRSITVSGGNLYDLASKEYGDASAWTQIAIANNLSDPTLSGISTLVIPPYSTTTSGGILSA